MKIYVGLGNPGKKYQCTRHNAGFMLVDALAQELGLNFKFEKKFNVDLAVKRDDVFLIKPQSFMNNSGQALRAFLNYSKIDIQDPFFDPEDLIVAHDDLDLILGTYKLQKATGPKDHNGLQSIYQHLHTKNFWHLRLGIDNREGLRMLNPADYVLQVFPENERQTINHAIKQLLQQLL